ncbi:MAG: hypothetical protein AB7O26_07840 [Planctomycetaceae bacterium]
MNSLVKKLTVVILGLSVVGAVTDTASAKWIRQIRNGRVVRIWVPDSTDFNRIGSRYPKPTTPSSSDTTPTTPSGAVVLKKSSSPLLFRR